MKKLLLLVCLQTSMVMEGGVKQHDYTSKKDYSGQSIKPKDNLCRSLGHKSHLTIDLSKKTEVTKSQWKPGKRILGKKRSKVSLRQVNEYSYRSDRSASVEVPVQKVTEEQKNEE